jgi:hypothetical protein
MNSKFGKYIMKDSPQTGTGDLLISVQAIEPLIIPIPDDIINNKFEIIINSKLQNINNLLSDFEKDIDILIYEMFKFTEEEIEFIESQ